MFKYLKKYNKHLLLTYFLVLLCSLLWVGSIVLEMFLFNASSGDSLSFVLIFLFSSILILVLYVSFSLLNQYVSSKIFEKIIFDIKIEIINTTNLLTYSDILIEKENIQSILINDINMINKSFFSRYVEFVEKITSMILLISLMIYLSWIMGLIMLAITIIFLFLTFVIKKNINKKTNLYNKNVNNYSIKTKKILDGINTLYFANKLELLTQLLLKKENQNIAKTNVDFQTYKAFNTLMFAILNTVVYTLIVTICAILLLNKNMLQTPNNGLDNIIKSPFAIFYVIYATTLTTTNYINVVVVIYIDMKTTMPIFAKLNNLYNDKKPYDKKSIDISDFDINIKNLDIAYDSKKVINNFNLNIIKNNKYAFVGKSGCGKSTIAKSICNLINIQSGSIKLNNKNYNFILDKIGYVDNIPYIFNATVKDNITLFDKNINQKRYQKLINLLELQSIDNDNIINESDNDLSVGQKQRINLARYLYLDYQYLILDEALCNIDKKTASKILNHLLIDDNLTLINISHHLEKNDFKKYSEVIQFNKFNN